MNITGERRDANVHSHKEHECKEWEVKERKSDSPCVTLRSMITMKHSGIFCRCLLLMTEDNKNANTRLHGMNLTEIHCNHLPRKIT